MAICFQCPSCQTCFTVPDNAAGKTGTCRKCGERVHVPQTDDGTIPLREEAVTGTAVATRVPASGDRSVVSPDATTVRPTGVPQALSVTDQWYERIPGYRRFMITLRSRTAFGSVVRLTTALMGFAVVGAILTALSVAWDSLTTTTQKETHVAPQQAQVAPDPLLQGRRAYKAELQSHELTLFTTMRDQIVEVFGGCKSAVEMMEDDDLILTVQFTDERTDEFWDRSTEQDKKRVAAMLLLMFGRELDRRKLLHEGYPVNVGVTISPGLSLSRLQYARKTPTKKLIEIMHSGEGENAQ